MKNETSYPILEVARMGRATHEVEPSYHEDVLHEARLSTTEIASTGTAKASR